MTVVAVAGGATLVSLTTAVPQLIWLSEHKAALFALAGFLLIAAGLLQWHGRHAPCPIEPAAARACQQARRTNRLIYIVSVVIFLIGFVTAFVLPRLLF